MFKGTSQYSGTRLFIDHAAGAFKRRGADVEIIDLFDFGAAAFKRAGGMVDEEAGPRVLGGALEHHDAQTGPHQRAKRVSPKRRRKLQRAPTSTQPSCWGGAASLG